MIMSMVAHDELSIRTETTLYRIYPTHSHFVLVDERMAADVVAKLCRAERGVECAITAAHKFIKENEQS